MSIVEKNKGGRPSLPETKRKIPIGLRVEQWVYDALAQQADEKDFESVNPLIRAILRDYVNNIEDETSK